MQVDMLQLHCVLNDVVEAAAAGSVSCCVEAGCMLHVGTPAVAVLVDYRVLPTANSVFDQPRLKGLVAPMAGGSVPNA